LLINGFKRHTCLLGSLLFIFIPISAIYGSTGDKLTAVIVTIEVLIFSGIYIFIWIKNTTKKERIQRVKQMIVAVVKWILIAGLCFLLVAQIRVNSNSVLQIDYKANGQVIITNESSRNYSGMDIVIQKGDKEVVYTKKIESEELLWAKENEYVKSEVDGEKSEEGIVVNGERLYWRYIVSSADVLKMDGEYIIEITVYQDDNYVVIKNSFVMQNEEYVFSQERIEKEY